MVDNGVLVLGAIIYLLSMAVTIIGAVAFTRPNKDGSKH